MINNSLTEEEARKKWCPLTFNNRGDAERCDACDCMAWQWATEGICNRWVPIQRNGQYLMGGLISDFPKPEEVTATKPSGEGWRLESSYVDIEETDRWMAHWVRDKDPNQRGYCGLACNQVIVQGGQP